MATKRESPPLARTQELWLLACAILTLVPDVEPAPIWLSASAGVALIWRSAIWWRRAALPPRWLLSFLVFAGSMGVFLTYRQFFGKDPGIALLIVFLALKLLEMRRVRDGLAVVFLCYFLLLTHFLNEQGLDVAGVTLAALVVITAALASLAHAGQSIVAYLRLSALMLAQAAPFMLVLFLLFPRVQGPLWGMPADAYSGMSGLSDSMSPGSISNLSLSGEIAFKLYDTFGFPVDLTQDVLRTRGLLVDLDGFNKAMEKAREEARRSWAGSGEAGTERIWFGLRERVSSSLSLAQAERETHAGQALVADALHRVNRLDVAQQFPLRLGPAELAGFPAGNATSLASNAMPRRYSP